MQQHIFSSKSLPKLKVVYLLSIWCFGYAIGVFLASASFHSSSSRIYLIISQANSPVFSWLFASIPLVLTIACVRLGFILGIYWIALVRSFTYAFASYLIYNAFGSAGWLVAPLCMFASTLCCLILVHFWFILSTTTICSKKRIAIYSFIYSFIIMVDNLCVSPFLAAVLN